ncbi:CpsD/CapB family tyrosine-protein kinase [Alkalibacter mobilis]|uniref:CpsD/CapB family tyrosine-protein kinase n=1 Tax=Alkalibacter mobilis TaxID=2787712 RepID=UPI00189FFA28|nr:CpsD/CapB family tyrosine-protein kinase [Alkalibacter mobilis]
MKLFKSDDYEVVEAYNMLVANLKIYAEKSKKILVTSAKELEGKTEVAYKLAKGLSESGEKILLIDADIRKSRFAETYGFESPKFGLVEILRDKRTVTEGLYKDLESGLTILFAGEASGNANLLLAGEDFSRLLDFCAERYDRVIVDAPALLGISDARLIADKCDSAVLVIQEDRVSTAEERKTLQVLKDMDVDIIGAVMTKATMKENLNKEMDYYKL